MSLVISLWSWIVSSLNFADNIISLAKECIPFAQDCLVHVLQIMPFWYAILGLQAGYGEGSGWILAGENVIRSSWLICPIS